LRSQIESSILAALQTAEQSGDSTNFQTIIGNAVQQTLQANGVSTDQFQQQMQSANGDMGGMMGMPPPSFANDSSTSSTSSSGTTNSPGSSSSTASTNSLNQQIEAAIVSALQNAQSSGASTDFQTITLVVFQEFVAKAQIAVLAGNFCGVHFG
jgi:hypothetical protein